MQVEALGHKITIQDYQNLPFCNRGDHPGRWIKKYLIEAPKTPAIGLDVSPADALTSFVDEEDRYWLPYTCRYRPISYTSFKTCLAKRHHMLHFWGDSNVRRSLKAITTGGAWCNTWYDPNTPECQCYDWHRPVHQFNPDKHINFFETVAGTKDASLFFYSWQGILPWGPNWKYDMQKSRLKTTLANFTANTHKDAMKPSAVIVSMSKPFISIFSDTQSKLGRCLWNIRYAC